MAKPATPVSREATAGVSGDDLHSKNESWIKLDTKVRENLKVFPINRLSYRRFATGEPATSMSRVATAIDSLGTNKKSLMAAP